MDSSQDTQSDRLVGLPKREQPEEKTFDKKSASSVEVLDEKVTPLDEKYLDADDVVLLNGEPVVTTGYDVSRFVVDLRDDGDAALTFRSLFLGTVFAGLGAALCQVCGFIPPHI